MTRRSPGYVLTRRSPYPPPPSVTRLGERRGGCTFPSTFPSTFPRLSLDVPLWLHFLLLRFCGTFRVGVLLASREVFASWVGWRGSGGGLRLPG